MPTLITIRNPGTAAEERIVTSHDTSTASLTDIKKLLDGVSFNESLAELDATSSAIDERTDVDISTSAPHSTNSCAQLKETSLYAETKKDDPDVTTLDDISLLNALDETTLDNDENCIESMVVRPNSKATKQRSSFPFAERPSNATNASTKDTQTSNSKSDRNMLSESVISPSSNESFTIERNQELSAQQSEYEERFKQQFENQVTSYIEDFKEQRPNLLVDYRKLSKEGKATEVQRSMKLLERLLSGKSRIRPNFEEAHGCSSDEQEIIEHFHARHTKSADSTSRATVILKDIGVTKGLDTTIDFEDENTSMALLSPFEQSHLTPQTPERNNGLSVERPADFVDSRNGQSQVRDESKIYRSPSDSRSRMRACAPSNNKPSHKRPNVSSLTPRASLLKEDKESYNMSHNLDVDFKVEGESIDSIECVRQDRKSSNSPMLVTTPLSTRRISQKRAASRSGKRGTDTSRFRKSSDSLLSVDHHEFLVSDEASSHSSLHSAGCASPQADILFTASQSPILHEPTILHTGDELDVESKNMNDSICSTTSGRDRRVRWNIDTYDSNLHEIPANVSLTEKAFFRMQPLQIRRLHLGKKDDDEDISIPTFPDPFEKYRGSERRKLGLVYEWIVARDEPKETSVAQATSGMIFSMKLPQITETVVKLVLKSATTNELQSEPRTNVLQGATLVICRTKEDTEKVASALREGTSGSVLNHAMLQLAERTRSKAASRCSTFDVVLSTFDAMMSKDVALTVNPDGHVVRTQGKQDGWLSSRASSHDGDTDTRLEKLSVLHMLDWRRTIFIDQLGRGSYVAKCGTLRAKAATALNSISRFVFFPPSEATKKQWEALRKSDRRAFQSVSAILRVSDDVGSDECSIFRSAIDLKNIRKAGR